MSKNKTQRTDLMLVSPENLTIEKGFNVRKDFGDILGLAHSVVQMGVIEPVVGYKERGVDRYALTEGHRRLAAVQLALSLHKKGTKGFEDISKIKRIALRSGSSDIKERLYTMAIMGNGKKPLTDLEKADMYSRLISLGKNEGHKIGAIVKDIVAKLGVSQATVYNTLKLNEIDPELKAFVESGSISGATVVRIAKTVKDTEKVKDAVIKAVYKAEESSRGNKKSKKATAADVEELGATTTLQRLKEVSSQLELLDISNPRTKLLNELIAAFESKKTVSAILQLFQ